MKRKRPNIVICLCDQLRAFEIGCYGHPTVRTPNMDRMAAEGPWFTVGVSNSPLCVPARSVLLNGQYARTCTGTSSNFVGFPPARRRVVCLDPLLPEVLAEAGYRNALIGKWHLHPAPDLVGFHEAVYPHNLHQHIGQSFYNLRGDRTVVEGFSLDYEFDHVREFVHRSRENPFFLLYSLSPPHMPIADAPERYLKMYSRDDVILRDNVWVDGKLANDRDWFRQYMWDYRGALALNLKDPEVYMPDDYRTRKAQGPTHGLKEALKKIRALMDDPDAGPAVRKTFPYLDDSQTENMDLLDLTALYYGMVTCVDDYLGRLIALLDEERLSEDTIVLFVSDHGDNLGSRHLWMKDRLYEESIRIPLLFRWAGRLAGREIVSQVGSLVDVMPTLLSLAGLQAPPTCQGQDLSPVLKGRSATAGENLAFIECWRHKAIGVRTLDHLYGVPMEGEKEADWRPVQQADEHLFFNLNDDPFEMDNLAGSGREAHLGEQLRRRLMRWHAETPRRPTPQPAQGESRTAAIY